MQDINKWEIEREQSQTWEICFEARAHLLYIPAFKTMKDFHYKPIPSDHSVPNTYKWVHTRTSLDSLVPSLIPARTTHRKHTSLSRPHLYNELSLELETMRTRKSASSKYKDENFGDHNTLIT